MYYKKNKNNNYWIIILLILLIGSALITKTEAATSCADDENSCKTSCIENFGCDQGYISTNIFSSGNCYCFIVNKTWNFLKEWSCNKKDNSMWLGSNYSNLTNKCIFNNEQAYWGKGKIWCANLDDCRKQNKLTYSFCDETKKECGGLNDQQPYRVYAAQTTNCQKQYIHINQTITKPACPNNQACKVNGNNITCSSDNSSNNSSNNQSSNNQSNNKKATTAVTTSPFAPVALGLNVNQFGEFMDACIGNGNCSVCAVLATFAYAINWLLKIGGLGAFIMLTWFGIMLLTSGGNSERLSKAKTGIVNTIIGLVVLFAGWTLINTVLATVIVGNPSENVKIFGSNWYTFCK
jgi:hypothetical protein